MTVGEGKVKQGAAPLGLACVNGFVKAKGYRTKFIDLDFSGITESVLIEEIVSNRPRFVGFTAVTTQILSSIRIAQTIKRQVPEVITVLGGPHPSALPELTASYSGIDLVVAGEGETPMLALLDGEPYEKIPGLFWTEDDVVRSNPRPPLLEDLDNVPTPDYEGLDIDRYQHSFFLSSEPFLPVMSGRGCPYNCVFCASEAVAKRSARYMTPVPFVDHIEDLKRRFGLRNFAFTDETFVLKVSHVEEICEEILSRNLNIRWVCQTRVNGLAEKVANLFKRAGCCMMALGVESGDQRILDLVGKGIKKDKIRQTCAAVKQAGIAITGFFILGLPHETPETALRTIEFAKELPLDLAQFAMFVPLPGSGGWDVALEGRVLRMYANTWDDFSRYTYPLVESDTLSRARLKELHSRALRKFYFQPKVIAARLARLTSPREIRNLFNMARGFTQLARAKRRTDGNIPMPVVTRENLTRLIGPLATLESKSMPVDTIGRPSHQAAIPSTPVSIAFPVRAG